MFGLPYFFIIAFNALTAILAERTTTGLNKSSVIYFSGIYFKFLYLSIFFFISPISVNNVICSFDCSYISGIISFINLAEKECHFPNNCPFFFLKSTKHSTIFSSIPKEDCLNSLIIPSFSVFSVKILAISSNSSLENVSMSTSISDKVFFIFLYTSKE